MFPIEDLRQAVETAKRILTKEKLDRQLTGQTSTSPFMSIRDGINRKVSFNTRDELGDKIDKLTVMLGKLAAKDNNNQRPFKPQIYKSRAPFPQGQNRGYNQRNCQSGNRLGNRSGSRDRRQFGQSNQRHNFSKITDGTTFKKALGDTEDKVVEGNIEMIGVMITIEVGIGQELGHSQEIIVVAEIEAQVIGG